MHTHKAFSLIELMVVIAIVAVLSAIALPAYKTYMIKVKASQSAANLMNFVNEQMTTLMTNGVFTIPFKINNIDIAPVTWGEVNVNNLEYVMVWSSNTEESMMLVGIISGLEGISGYESPSVVPPGEDNVYNQLAVASRIMSNGTIKTVCGHYSAAYSSNYIPLAYLPSSCQCAEVETFYNFGSGC